MSCHKPIKLERKDDDSGWLKFNMDNSLHVHPHKQKQPQQYQQQSNNFSSASKSLSNDARILQLLQSIDSKLTALMANNRISSEEPKK
jgi:hypothetical protein